MKYFVLVAGIALLFAHSETAFTAQVGSQLAEINASYEWQESLFETLAFKARYMQPLYVLESPLGSERESVARSLANRTLDPARLSIIEMDYQLDRNGRFFFQTTELTVHKASLREEDRMTPSVLAFDGEQYRFFAVPGDQGPGLGSIFLPEHPYDYSKPMVKPTFYLDHIFNEKVSQILSDPDAVTITETANRTSQIDYLGEGTQDAYRLELDPKQDFMIVMMRGPWTEKESFEKRAEYAQSEEGFWYPVKGTLSIGGGEPTVLEVTEFRLNAPEHTYSPEIPVGTRVTNHTQGFPEIYYEGQPGKTAEESGDESIYTMADRLNRLELFDLDERLEKIEPSLVANMPTTVPPTPGEEKKPVSNQPATEEKVSEQIPRPYIVTVTALLVILLAAWLFLRKRGRGEDVSSSPRP